MIMMTATVNHRFSHKIVDITRIIEIIIITRPQIMTALMLRHTSTIKTLIMILIHKKSLLTLEEVKQQVEALVRSLKKMILMRQVVVSMIPCNVHQSPISSPKIKMDLGSQKLQLKRILQPKVDE